MNTATLRSIAPALLAALLLPLGGCDAAGDDPFSRLGRGDGDGQSPGPAPELCWGIGVDVQMRDDASPPAGSGDINALLFRSEDVDDRGFPFGDEPPLEALAEPSDGFPASFRFCLDQRIDYGQVAIVAVMDVDGDDLTCEEGDFLGTSWMDVDPSRDFEVDVVLEVLVAAGDCPSGDDAPPEE